MGSHETKSFCTAKVTTFNWRISPQEKDLYQIYLWKKFVSFSRIYWELNKKVNKKERKEKTKHQGKKQPNKMLRNGIKQISQKEEIRWEIFFKSSIFLAIKEIKVKIILRFLLIPVFMAK